MSGKWQDSVPLNWNNRESRTEPQQQDTYGNMGSNGSNGIRDNGNTRPVNRRPSDLNMQASEPDPPRSRRPSAANTSTSSIAGKKRSMRSMRPPQRRTNEPLPDDSAWIHRDKLAQIEIQEMEEAGIYVPVKNTQRSSSARPDSTRPDSQSPSRNGHSRTQSKDGFNETASSGDDDDDGLNGGYSPHEENAKDRDSAMPDSTFTGAEQVTSRNVEYDPGLDSYQISEGTTYDTRQERSSSLPRPGTSRIPISRQSPMPVSQDVQDREAPLSRSPEGSGTWDHLQYARKARSGSIGSQVLLDDNEFARPSSSHLLENESPQKGKSPGRATPKGRKSSGSTQRGARSNRATSSTRRPGSSSNNRPSTSQRNSPEGDPPWLVSMYKPDPRLPPDQQMLPTHAKRLARERWEREGKTGSVYDTEFNLLNDEDPSQPKAPVLSLDQNRLDSNTDQPRRSLSPYKQSPQPSPSAEQENGSVWPLPSPGAKSEAKSEAASPRPGTSGGYRITPTITPAPPIQSPKPVASPRASQQQQERIGQNTTPRVPVLDEKDEVKEKKGCCCVMM